VPTHLQHDPIRSDIVFFFALSFFFICVPVSQDQDRRPSGQSINLWAPFLAPQMNLSLTPNLAFGFIFFFRVSSASAAAAVVDSSISKGFQGLY